MRSLTSYALALLILLGIAAWMISGTLIEGGRGEGRGEQPLIEAIDGENGPLRPVLEFIGLLPRQEDPAQLAMAQTAPETPARPLVRVMESVAQDLPQIVPLRGRTQANAIIAARAETSGIVQAVHFSRGERVEAGALLCTLAHGTRQARVSTAEARLEQARADLENNAELRERGVAPANTARQAEVALLAAQADYDEALAELDRTRIHAEVSGIIAAPHVNIGDSLAAGGECATIVQLDPILFVGQIAEARIGLVQEGESATLTTVTGQEVEASVRYISAVADPGTRAFDIELIATNPDGAIRDGVTAEARIAVGTVRAHLLPPSVLTLDGDGVLGLRAVEDGVVTFHPAEIALDSREGMWLTGLPETLEVITLGQELVQSGDMVDTGRVGDARP